MYTFSRKYDEVLILAPNGLTLDLRYKFFKYQCQTRILNFKVNLTRFKSETIFAKVLILMVFK